MTDRPILFSAPMVQALLAGRKTQTRRALKHPEYYGCPTGDCPHNYQAECDTAMAALDADATRFAPGGRLYVREDYYQRGYWAVVDGGYTKCGAVKRAFLPSGEPTFNAPAQFRSARDRTNPNIVAWYKRLGRFMPRWASRLTLTVTDVRVERLQAISEADAIVEGVYQVANADPQSVTKRFGFSGATDSRLTAKRAYRDLWDQINGPGAWETNPWVTAISFSVARGNIDEVQA